MILASHLVLRSRCGIRNDLNEAASKSTAVKNFFGDQFCYLPNEFNSCSISLSSSCHSVVQMNNIGILWVISS